MGQRGDNSKGREVDTERFWQRGLPGYLLHVGMTGLLPAAWFRPPIPGVDQRRPCGAMPTLEIVSHCWQYAPMLAYQLSSLVLYPPTRLHLVMTVYHAAADEDTVRLLDFIGQRKVTNVEWNWQRLPPSHLFRRSIGRNQAALATQADWIWMTDCDIVFHEGCLDSTADALRGRRDRLVFPRCVERTGLLEQTSPMLNRRRALEIVAIDTTAFTTQSRDRAKGPFQIVHGDVARAIGYCDGIRLYQTPAAHWCKCYEDRAFRWLVGTPGTPVDIVKACQIRHAEKGRYRQGSAWSRLRGAIRRMQE